MFNLPTKNGEEPKKLASWEAGLKISIIGTGYVGLVVGTCFAKLGHDIICTDVAKNKIEMINKGIAPIYEKGLDEILSEVAGRRLWATNDISEVLSEATICFICVGAPSSKEGLVNMDFIKQACKQIGQAIKALKKEGHPLVVVKSTVVPGTTEKVLIPLLEESSGMLEGRDFGVCVNPEFLREGNAVYDFFNPDRIIVGTRNQRGGKILKELYKNFESPLIITNLKTAEMTKCAANAFLATKISFINEIANICKKLAIDIYDVAHSMGLDLRISPHFLKAGPGFGGSCLPKDTQVLARVAKEIGYEPTLIKAVLEVNEAQPLKVVELTKEKIGDLSGKKNCYLRPRF